MSVKYKLSLLLVGIALSRAQTSTNNTEVIEESEEEMPSLSNRDDVTCGRSPFNLGRIVRGHEAILHANPWMISIRYRNQNWGHWCGGSIVNKEWVVTAAHCMNTTNANDFKIIAGAHKRIYAINDTDKEYYTRQKRDVAQIKLHPKYNQFKSHDIALLKLSRPLEWTRYVSPICMPTEPVQDGKKCTVTGWGCTNGTLNNIPEVLQTADVPIIQQSTCKRKTLFEAITDYDICAKYSPGGTCYVCY